LQCNLVLYDVEDVLEVFPMLIPETILEWFVFIWGCEQCFKMSGQISHESHYYLKDLIWMYYACLGLPYGKEDQTFLINDEPTKLLWNLKWSGFFLIIKGTNVSKNKVQWLDLASQLWPMLLEFPLIKTIWIHYDRMVKYSKHCLSLCLKNYYWFV
jgi:hypothetical protein